MSDQPRNYILPDGSVLPVQEISTRSEPIVMPERVKFEDPPCVISLEIFSYPLVDGFDVRTDCDPELVCRTHGTIKLWESQKEIQVNAIHELVVEHYNEHHATYEELKRWGIA